MQGKFSYDIMKDLLGDGIFAVDGNKWRHQRKIASYEFSAKVLRDYSGAVFKSNATKLAEIVLDAASTNQMIDIQASIRRRKKKKNPVQDFPMNSYGGICLFVLTIYRICS